MYRIETGNEPPVQKRSYRYSPADKAEISRQTHEMLDAGIIELSDTPWKSSILLLAKKNSPTNEKRLALDFRNLNRITLLTSFPLITLTDVLDAVGDAKPTLWSALDLKSGYWQVALDPETAEKTGFQTHERNFISKGWPSV